jgi:hypothetical protein
MRNGHRRPAMVPTTGESGDEVVLPHLDAAERHGTPAPGRWGKDQAAEASAIPAAQPTRPTCESEGNGW